jgi:hypothetical protein
MTITNTPHLTASPPPQITVTSRLVSHRIPSFAFVIKETDKGGPVLDEACRKRSVDHKYFLDLKVVQA